MLSRLLLLVGTLVAAAADFPHVPLDVAKYDRYFGVNNGFCALNGTVFTRSRSVAHCELLGGTFNVLHESQASWDAEHRRAVRRHLSSSEETYDTWILELAPSVSIADVKKELGTRDVAPMNKPDVIGEGFAIAYASYDSVESLSPSLVTSASPLPPSLKISAFLRASDGGRARAVLSPGVVATREDARVVAKELSEMSGIPFTGEHDMLGILSMEANAPPASIAALSAAATDPRVLRLVPEPLHRVLNKYGAPAIQSGVPTASPFYDAGLHGSGQIVGVADSGLDYGHCYFYDESRPITNLQTGDVYNDASARKIVQYVAFADAGEGEDGGHGTHVSGSVMGYPSLSGACATQCSDTDTATGWKGQAYEAKVAFFDIGIANQRFLTVPNDVTTITQNAYDAGARIHTNSWGSPSNFYSGGSYGFDKFSYDNQDFVVLVAAGNDGGPTANLDGTVGAPATGKNVIAVGAGQQHADFWTALNAPCTSCSNDDIATFSSRGPTYDDRFKPEIISPGLYVGSADSTPSSTPSCGITFQAGTSMATPLLAGTAALVREYLYRGFYPSGSENAGDAFVPMGALIKAVILHSGQDISGGTFCGGFQDCSTGNGGNIQTAPDSTQGFGRAQINTVLNFDSGRTFLAGKCPLTGACVLNEDNTWGDGNVPSVAPGEVVEYPISVTSDATSFKATLVWHDAVSTSNIGTSAALINDIDLVVVDPSGNTHLPKSANGGTPAVDTTNTVEMVEQTFAAGSGTGTWTVRVTGTDVTSGPSQPFALVVTSIFDLDGVTNNGGGGFASGILTGTESGPLAGAVVGTLFLLAATVVAVWYLPAKSFGGLFVFASERGVEFVVAIVCAIVTGAKTEAGGWRVEGAFGLSVLAAIYTFLLLCSFAWALFVPDSPARACVDSPRFSLITLAIDLLIVGMCVILWPSLASSPAADAAMVLVVFVLFVLFCISAVLYFISRGGKQGGGGVKRPVEKISTASSGTSAGSRSTPKPKPKPKPKPPKKKKKTAIAKGSKVRAKWAYAASQGDELDMSKGDVIQVTSVQADGWCQGTNTRTRKSGFFPKNYVAAV